MKLAHANKPYSATITVDHMAFLTIWSISVYSVFMVLLETKKKFLKLTKCPWVRNEYIPNEQRFIFLLETENASLCF